MRKLMSRQKPLEFPEYEVPDIAAIKALKTGTATPDQQLRAINFIMKNMCQIGGLSFDPDSRIEAFSEGKRFVGLTLLQILDTPIDSFKPKSITTKR